MRRGPANGNWKGGLCRIKHVDELLKLPKHHQDAIRKKLLHSYKIDRRTKCWLWTGSVFRCNGRACIQLGGNWLAYRVAYVLFRNTTVGSLIVMHTCDNGICINPNHLRPGTNADNSADMVAKGRQATGDRNGSRLYPERLVRGDAHPLRQNPERVQCENNGMAQLTNEQVLEIRTKYRPYINNHKPSNQRDLAEEYRVSVSIIASIGKGKAWRSLLC